MIYPVQIVYPTITYEVSKDLLLPSWANFALMCPQCLTIWCKEIYSPQLYFQAKNTFCPAHGGRGWLATNINAHIYTKELSPAALAHELILLTNEPIRLMNPRIYDETPTL